MRGFDIKQIRMRSFQISGLTAKWGIGDSRKPPISDNNLIGYWDARNLPDGALATIANKATLAAKAPDLTVTGATMASGTLQFDGVNDEAFTGAFVFPERYTVFWDVDWLGSENKTAGITVHPKLYMYNFAATGAVRCFIKSSSSYASIPNTSVGLSTNGKVYAKDGSVTPFGGTVGTNTGRGALYIAGTGTNYTQLGFRQLLIFNKELSQAEVNDVLRAMFPA